ncbi:MAG: Erg28 like protein-domain-containing protein [Olpidium bornovanus]|uniref:Erg28 like protein-domain-containing protein n=1 Tax=Olpidium bornovanus TaxID=278681 RepID=A0A8H8A098_9FUNG|nr:MAG: Erg28 like protein-domain-containing protein [Olpidium bornovanus]
MLDLAFRLMPDGALPKWLLLVSATSFFNTAQNYLLPVKLTRRVYSSDRKAVTPLASRLFGTWTLASANLRPRDLVIPYRLRPFRVRSSRVQDSEAARRRDISAARRL